MVGRTQRWIRVASLWLSLFLLLSALGAAQAIGPNPNSENALWVAESHDALKIATGDGTVLLTIKDTGQVRAVTIDSQRERVWVLTSKELRAYGFGGDLAFTVPVKAPDSTHAVLRTRPSDGSIWLAVNQNLWSFSFAGEPLAETKAAGLVQDLSFDSTGQTLWVATPMLAQALDGVSGDQVGSIAIPKGDQLQDLALDPKTGNLWLALQDGVDEVTSSGDVVQSWSLTGVERVAADDLGGAWFTSNKEAYHLDETGALAAGAEVCSGEGTIEAIVVDPSDSSLWAACSDHVAQIATARTVAQSVPLAPSEQVWDLAIYADIFPPTLSIVSPPDGSLLNKGEPPLTLQYSDLGSGVDPSTLAFTVNGAAASFDCSPAASQAVCTSSVKLPEGAVAITATVEDFAGNVSTPATLDLTIDTIPPNPVDLGLVTVSTPDGGEVSIDGAPGSSEPASKLTVKDGASGAVAHDIVAADGSFEATIAASGDDVLTLTLTDAAGNVSDPVTVTVPEPGAGLPPDPSSVAPPLDTTVATDIYSSTEFLYSGSNPIQSGVVPGAIDQKRVVILRGRVLDRSGNALPGVQISIHDHPEYGVTYSRLDGRFDFVANGGGTLTIQYTTQGYIPAQRRVDVPWRDFVSVDDVVLIQIDSKSTEIQAGSSSIQIASGSVVQDSDGTRQARVLFPAGTTATMEMPDGSTQPLSSMTVRATEFTVGPLGPETMPARLPPTSGYTYAVNLSVDEAQAAGATSVQFNQPAYVYVDNFLHFPVGQTVPSGYYDPARAQWIPSDNGIVIKIIGVNWANEAMLDVDGNGTAALYWELVDLGITTEERIKLAATYPVGTEFWRVPVTHFSTWDFNWPFGPPGDATQPPHENTDKPITRPPKPLPPKYCKTGSIIGCEDQTLGERIPITGTPYSLVYSSDRVPDRKGMSSIKIHLAGPSVPASLKRIDLRISIAGEYFRTSYPPEPNQYTEFTWDGKDAYGRSVSSEMPVGVDVGYVYDGVYFDSGNEVKTFTTTSHYPDVPITGDRVRQEVTIWQHWSDILTSPNQVGRLPVAGWSVNVHNMYDPRSGTILLGDGGRRSAQNLPAVINKFADVSAGELVAGSDGSVYFAGGLWGGSIYRIDSLGVITPVAGDYSGCQNQCEGLPATDWYLGQIGLMTVGGPDNSLYFFAVYPGTWPGQYVFALWRLDHNGVLHYINQVPWVAGIAADSAGNVYVSEGGLDQILKVDVLGDISVFAGIPLSNGWQCSGLGDGGSAYQACLWNPGALTMDRAGELYVADPGHCRIRKIDPQGIITTVAGSAPLPDGTCKEGDGGDGGPAVDATFSNLALASLSMGPDGSLIIGESRWYGDKVRKIWPNGTISMIAGNGGTSSTGDTGPAAAAGLCFNGSTSLPDGSVMVSDCNGTLRRISEVLPNLSGSQIFVPSRSGSLLYAFNANGRHLATINTFTGSRELTFGYDSSGKLTSIKDANGNITSIERDTAGNPTAIVAPYGQRTALAVDSHGYLSSITDPSGATTRLTYTPGGLLTSLKDAKGQLHTFTYDSLGFLTKDADPAGGFTAASRVDYSDSSWQTVLTSAMGRSDTYNESVDEDNSWINNHTSPSGLLTASTGAADGDLVTVNPDGSRSETIEGPDPRFGMESPLPAKTTITTPAGLTFEIDISKSAVLSTPGDPLSLKVFSANAVINGRTFESNYDQSNHSFTLKSAEGRQILGQIDDQGRLIRVQMTGLAPTLYSYDSHGRLSTAVTDSGSVERRVSLTYDALGRLTSITDPASRTLALSYDSNGRVIRETLPDGRTIGFTYDGNGNLTSLTPPMRPEHEFTYNAIDQTSSYNPPTLGSQPVATSYSYNLDHQLQQIVRPDGGLIDFSYDAGGRLSGIAYPGGGIDYSYGGGGHLATANTSDGEDLSHTWDGFLPTGVTWSGLVSGSVKWSFDNNFVLKAEAVNDLPLVPFAFDKDLLLTQAGDETLSRDPVSGLLAGTALGAVSTSRTYDPFGDVATSAALVSGSDFYNVSYTRDKLGRITEKQETISGTTSTYDYTYDTAGRLTTVTKDGAAFESYTYDGNSNRIAWTDPWGSGAAIYDAQDRLLSAGAASYTYSANGELESKTENGQTVSYHYDALGNLRSIVLPTGINIDYVIDAQNRRVGKEVNGTLVQGFLYQDQLNPIAELDDAGKVSELFVYGSKADVPDYMVKMNADGSRTTYRILSDQVGSVRFVINAADGTVAQEIDYDSFGRVMLDTNPGFQPFGFAGGLYDYQTGFVRFGARDYDPAIGRWTSKDPILFGGRLANLYSYVLSDPVNALDLSGLQWVCIEKLMWVTSYNDVGAGADWPHFKPTTPGARARSVGPGTVAVADVSPPEYPFGTQVTVWGDQGQADYQGTVEDTGKGWRVDNRNWPPTDWIDIWIPGHESKVWGVQQRWVTLCYDQKDRCTKQFTHTHHR